VARDRRSRTPEGVLFDSASLAVENFGLTDNLMIVHGLDLHGCPVVIPNAAPADPWHDLAAFKTCLQLLNARRR
jgi:hypothetical protein